MPCPSHVNIPGCFAAYNLSFTMGFVTGLKHYVMSAGLTSDQTSRASLCTGCGRCERHCPQKLSVAGSLKLVRRRFEPFWIRWGIGAFRLFLGRAGKKS
jgi:predicted aldo/keto reductase-like oxidoreductase